MTAAPGRRRPSPRRHGGGEGSLPTRGCFIMPWNTTRHGVSWRPIAASFGYTILTDGALGILANSCWPHETNGIGSSPTKVDYWVETYVAKRRCDCCRGSDECTPTV